MIFFFFVTVSTWLLSTASTLTLLVKRPRGEPGNREEGQHRPYRPPVPPGRRRRRRHPSPHGSAGRGCWAGRSTLRLPAAPQDCLQPPWSLAAASPSPYVPPERPKTESRTKPRRLPPRSHPGRPAPHASLRGGDQLTAGASPAARVKSAVCPQWGTGPCPSREGWPSQRDTRRP